MTKLSEIDLIHEEEIAFRRWLKELASHYEQEDAIRDSDLADQAQAEERATKFVANARECAELHGVVAWMLPEYQATGAWESWLAAAEYFEIDEHFEPDAADQELWEQAYMNRLAELRRAS